MNQVKAIRQRYQIKRPEFAALLGVSVRTLEGWESGRFTPSGAAKKLLQVIGASHEAFAQLQRFKGEEQMIELERDPETLTIMGVPFATPKAYQAAVNAIANNMFEGYVPTVEDVRHLVADAQGLVDPREILEQVEAEEHAVTHD